MQRKYFSRISILMFMLSCLLFSMPAVSLCAAKKTLKREADPIVISGCALKGLNGAAIENVRLFALRGDKLAVVPFQIDKKNSDGEYVFPGHAESLPSGKLECRDELVFMAKDTGGRVDKKKKPSGAAEGIEIEVSDPAGKGKGWVYLFSFPAGRAPALSPVDYVQCKSKCTSVESRNYIVGFSQISPLVFDTLIVKKDGGGNGKDVLDRLKVRFHGETKFGLTIDRTENDFTSELAGVIDGPVRIIRRTDNRMILYAKIPTPSCVSEQVFYYNSFLFPVVINVPINLGLFLKNTYLSVTSESSMPWGSRFYNTNNKRGVDVDGRMSAPENALNRGSYNWQVVCGSKPGMTGGWLNRLEFDRKKTPADVRLYYLDDKTVPAPPDDVPGQFGNLGYKIIGIERLHGGQHLLMTYMYNLNSYKPGEEKKWLNIIDKPLKASVKTY